MDIESRQVIPAVGPELLEIDGDNGPITLYQHIARELVSRLSLDSGSLPERFGLLEVTSLYSPDPRTAPTSVYETRGILTERSWPAPHRCGNSPPSRTASVGTR